jgi:hypothetical protein
LLLGTTFRLWGEPPRWIMELMVVIRSRDEELKDQGAELELELCNWLMFNNSRRQMSNPMVETASGE